MWTQGFERVDCAEVNEHKEEQKDYLIDNVLLDFEVPQNETSGGLIGDFVKGCEMEKIGECNIKTDVEVLTRIATK